MNFIDALKKMAECEGLVMRPVGHANNNNYRFNQGKLELCNCGRWVISMLTVNSFPEEEWEVTGNCSQLADSGVSFLDALNKMSEDETIIMRPVGNCWNYRYCKGKLQVFMDKWLDSGCSVNGLLTQMKWQVVKDYPLSFLEALKGMESGEVNAIEAENGYEFCLTGLRTSPLSLDWAFKSKWRIIEGKEA